MDKGGGVGEQAAFGQRGEAAFHDPTAGLNGKTFGWFRTADDLQMEPAVGTQLFDPGHESAGVTRVGPDLGQTAKGDRGPTQQRLGSVAVLHIGGGVFRAEVPARRVGQQVRLAPCDLLVRVLAAGSALAGGFDALAVEDGRRRGFFFRGLGPGLVAQSVRVT